MRKIPPELDNPIDNVLIDIANSMSNIFYQSGFTPNVLTSISLTLGITSAYLMYKDNYTLAALLYFASYYFDCFDGFFARKYDMETPFGDFFDHLSDWFKFVLIFYVMYLKNKKLVFIYFFIFLFLLSFTYIHIGCQEEIYDKRDMQPMLRIFMCPGNPYDIAKYARYMGSGTINLIFTLMILTFPYFSQKISPI